MREYFYYYMEGMGVVQCHFPKTCDFCLDMIAEIPNDLVKICQICGHMYMKGEWVAKKYGWNGGECHCKGLVNEGIIDEQKKYPNWLKQQYLNTWGEKLPDYR
jgi:hypothetical protein